MKTKILLVFILFFGYTFSQKLISRVSLDGTSTFYQQIDSAIHYATTGDYIYIPGGNYSIGNLIIDKSVHLVGVGHYPDSSVATGITFLNGNIKIVNTASGGSLSGVYLSGDLFYGTNATDQNVQNFVIEKNSVNTVKLSFDGSSYNSNSFNTLFQYNVVRGLFNGGDVRGLNIFNNIISGGGYYHLYFVTSAEIKNNIFLDGHFNDYVSGSTFQNNIFVDGMGGNATPNSSSNNLYFNNLYVNVAVTEGGNGALIVFGNQIIGINDIFENNPGIQFSYSGNYHLKSTVNDVLMGNDGTEVGIYGSVNPYKDGALPNNPHIQSKQINSATLSNGMLPVNIKVSAQ